MTAVASKAVAAAKGPLHALRGTGESEKMLKNAKTEYLNEIAAIAIVLLIIIMLATAIQFRLQKRWVNYD